MAKKKSVTAKSTSSKKSSKKTSKKVIEASQPRSSKAKPKKSVKSAQTSKRPASSNASASKPPAPKNGLVSTGFWLLKSEPESYSIEQFSRDGKTLWTGVRNYLARNFMMDSMRPGDRFLFYHSSAEPPAAVGIGEILRINLPDPSALEVGSDYFDPKASADHPIWFCAEVGFVATFPHPVTLAEIRARTELAQMALLQKGQRLSIQPVSAVEFETIAAMGGVTGGSTK